MFLVLTDSNTHGYCADPGNCADGGIRFNESERWTALLQQKLGEEYLVIEEGLSGRTTVFRDPLHEGMAAIDYICPCLKSHETVDLLIIMLGTNDTKDRFAVNAACIGLGMARLVRKAQTVDCWGDKAPNILVIAPPAIGKGMLTSTVAGIMGNSCVEKSLKLAKEYKMQCELLNVHFLDADTIGCEFNQIDYMHLTRKGHAALADYLAQKVPEYI